MRQNRVDPFGNFILTEARGSLWGNRGALHNEKDEIVRPFRLEQWITCTLDYKGIRRQIMAPGRLTELFFTDEATSFAAGHRPCALCRRPAFNFFKSCWVSGNPQYGFDSKTSIRKIDHVLHAERISDNMQKITYFENPDHLPDGTMVVYQGGPCLIKNHQLHPWTAFGYDAPVPIPKENLEVLTPASTVNAFRAGYHPIMVVKAKT